MHQRIADAIELFKDPGLLLRGDADSVVDNLEVDAAVLSVEIYAQILLSRRVLEGVVHQIEQRTSDGFAIHLQRWQIVVDLLLEVEAVVLDFKAIRIERAAYQIANVGLAKAVLLLARLDAGEVEDIVDQRGKTLAFLANDLVVLLVLGGIGDASQLQSLSVETNERERCSQLVRDVGDEIGLQFGQREFAGDVAVGQYHARSHQERESA